MTPISPEGANWYMTGIGTGIMLAVAILGVWSYAKTGGSGVPLPALLTAMALGLAASALAKPFARRVARRQAGQPGVKGAT